MTLTGLTIEDLEAMPDDGRRYELIGGAIVVTPVPDVTHQRVSYRLQQLSRAWPEVEVFDAPIDLDLPGGQRVQPDLVAVARGRSGPRLELPVALVVEIVSAGSRTNDAVTKRATYAAAGIPAYWIVDPDGEITALRLDDTGSYRVYAQGRTVVIDWPFAVELDVAALCQPPA